MSLRVVVYVAKNTPRCDEVMLRSQIEEMTGQRCHVRISREREVPCPLAVFTDYEEPATLTP